jgi:hypothetical protein
VRNAPPEHTLINLGYCCRQVAVLQELQQQSPSAADWLLTDAISFPAVLAVRTSHGRLLSTGHWSVCTSHCFCPALRVLRVLCGSRILVGGFRSLVARGASVQPIFETLRRAEVDQSEHLADLFPIISDFVQFWDGCSPPRRLLIWATSASRVANRSSAQRVCDMSCERRSKYLTSRRESPGRRACRRSRTDLATRPVWPRRWWTRPPAPRRAGRCRNACGADGPASAGGF